MYLTAVHANNYLAMGQGAIILIAKEAYNTCDVELDMPTCTYSLLHTME